MSEKKSPYLHLVRSADSVEETATIDTAADASTVSTAAATYANETPLNAPLQQAIMYAAVSWVVLVIERSVFSVDIQPVSRRLYEVSVHYADDQGPDGSEADGEGIILRVQLAIDPGLVIRTTVEPVRP